MRPEPNKGPIDPSLFKNATNDVMLKFFKDTAKAAGVGLVDNRDYVTRIVQEGIIKGDWNNV